MRPQPQVGCLACSESVSVCPVAVCGSVLRVFPYVHRCVAVCGSVLQCVCMPQVGRLDCSNRVLLGLHCVAVCGCVCMIQAPCPEMYCRLLQSVAECCRVLQCVQVSCSVLPCAAVCRFCLHNTSTLSTVDPSQRLCCVFLNL